MVFLSICPRDKKYLEYAVGDIPLRVVLDDGAEINPDVKVNVTDLNKGYKHFKIDSGKGNELKVNLNNNYYLITYRGLSLGFGKCANKVMKNKYPKGLRRVI